MPNWQRPGRSIQNGWLARIQVNDGVVYPAPTKGAENMLDRMNLGVSIRYGRHLINSDTLEAKGLISGFP